MNMNMNEEDTIRDPDTEYTDQLVEPSIEDQTMNQVIQTSLQEWKEHSQANEEYEQRIMQQYTETRLEREGIFKSFIVTLKKLAKYDKNMEEILDLLENIIESYCLGYMEVCELDRETVDKIFKEISKIRVEKKVIELLHNLLQKSE